MTGVPEEVYREFRRIGKFLDRRQLISSHAGNVSARRGRRMYVKRRGAMLGDLRPHDVVELRLDAPDSNVMVASTEAGVHAAIYEKTRHLAVIHCHPPHAVALSLVQDEITAIDAEGAFTLKKIPVLDLEHPVGPVESAVRVPPVLKKYNVVMVRSHGIFAGGTTLEEAYMWCTVCEEIATIRYLTMQTGKPLLRDVSGLFREW
ncbi:MAG: class II aldolase/adducin family protein [Promethearchaeota archaeon]